MIHELKTQELTIERVLMMINFLNEGNFWADKKYQTRYEVRNFFSRYLPTPYLRYLYKKEKDKGIKAQIFRPSQTDVVIEGYPRSANTFAYVAFISCQQQKLSVAHHLHLPAQVTVAAKHRIPCLVLYRNPEDSVISYSIFAPKLTVKQALKGYINFYEPILKLKDSYLLASFDEAIQDFGKITQQLNRKFGTQFGEFEHSKQNEEKCFKYISDYTLEHQGKASISGEKAAKNAIAHRISCPSENRNAQKEKLRIIYRSKKLTSLRKKAEEIYLTLVDIKDCHSAS